jgi:hypothetical protein
LAHPSRYSGNSGEVVRVQSALLNPSLNRIYRKDFPGDLGNYYGITGEGGLLLRIAVMILSLVLMFVLAMPTCAIFVGGALGNDEAMAMQGGMGFVLVVGLLLSGAFALGRPKVSMVTLITVGVVNLALGTAKTYSVIAFGLAIMAYFGHKELRSSRRPDRDQRYTVTFRD